MPANPNNLDGQAAAPGPRRGALLTQTDSSPDSSKAVTRPPRSNNRYFCFNGQHYCRLEDFTQTQLLKGTGIGRNSTISCREHTKGLSTELKCMGWCERILPTTCFSKTQRGPNGGQRCLECIEYQLSFEPGRKALPPPGKHQREYQENVRLEHTQRALKSNDNGEYNDDDGSTSQQPTSCASSSIAGTDADETVTVVSHVSTTKSSAWGKQSQRKTQYITPDYLEHNAEEADEAYYTDGSADEC